MDPLTILAMANGAVAAVKAGCQLYKDIKGAAGNVKEVLNDLEKTFHSQHKDKPPSQEAVKQYNAERERVKEIAKHDPNDVISKVGDQLNAFFEAFDQIEQLFWEEERNAKKVYSGNDSLGKRALQRVLIRTRLEKMQVEMRETMIYDSPAELGDLWTRFQQMREQITQEQEIARAEHRRKEVEQAWQRDQLINKWRSRAGDLLLVVLVVAYLWALLWGASKHREILQGFLQS
jgi:anion-transporting  ArsA/GET3 family ATPase